ncbi:cell wall hydrolase, partial [Acinetobacter baumannii]
GQQAVAQVILNRVRHPAFPATVCGVVYQGSEHAGCQFSFACDGSMARRPEPGLWRRAMAVAASALAGQVYAPVGLATHYHTYAVTPAWNR